MSYRRSKKVNAAALGTCPPGSRTHASKSAGSPQAACHTPRMIERRICRDMRSMSLRSWAATAPEASIRLTNATWFDARESSAGSTALAGALRAPAMATDRCAAAGWAPVAAAGASLPAWRMSRRSSEGGLWML